MSKLEEKKLLNELDDEYLNTSVLGPVLLDYQEEILFNEIFSICRLKTFNFKNTYYPSVIALEFTPELKVKTAFLQYEKMNYKTL